MVLSGFSGYQIRFDGVSIAAIMTD